jgi:hypothetical protein
MDGINISRFRLVFRFFRKYKNGQRDFTRSFFNPGFTGLPTQIAYSISNSQNSTAQASVGMFDCLFVECGCYV